VGGIQGTLTGLAFWALGLDSALLWGLVTGICSLVPMIGSATIWAPAGVVLVRILVLVSGQRLNGVELRGFSRWKKAKHDPCQKSTGEGDNDRYNSEDYAPTCDRGGC
jgi:hypothetical protein